MTDENREFVKIWIGRLLWVARKVDNTIQHITWFVLLTIIQPSIKLGQEVKICHGTRLCIFVAGLV